MDPTPLQSAESWSNIVAGGVTAGAALLAVLATVIRFLLLPLGNNWVVTLGDLRLRKTAGGWAYLITINVQNKSSAPQEIRGWWRRVLFPDAVDASYDANSSLDIYSIADAIANYGSDSGVERYSVPPGESYQDLVLKERDGTPQQYCYIEYTLRYRRWTRKFLVVPSRDWEVLSQILVVPVSTEDLAKAENSSPNQSS